MELLASLFRDTKSGYATPTSAAGTLTCAEGYASYADALLAADDAADTARRMLELHREMSLQIRALQERIDHIEHLHLQLERKVDTAWACTEVLRVLALLHDGILTVLNTLSEQTAVNFTKNTHKEMLVATKASRAACADMINSCQHRLDLIEKNLSPRAVTETSVLAGVPANKL